MLAAKTRTATGAGLCEPQPCRGWGGHPPHVATCAHILVWDAKSVNLRRSSQDGGDLTEKPWPDPGSDSARGGDSRRQEAPVVAPRPDIFLGHHTRWRGALPIGARCRGVGRGTDQVRCG